MVMFRLNSVFLFLETCYLETEWFSLQETFYHLYLTWFLLGGLTVVCLCVSGLSAGDCQICVDCFLIHKTKCVSQHRETNSVSHCHISWHPASGQHDVAFFFTLKARISGSVCVCVCPG